MYDTDGDISVDEKVFNQLSFSISAEVITVFCFQVIAEEMGESANADLSEFKIPELNSNSDRKN